LVANELDARFQAARRSQDLELLVKLGCDLSDAGRPLDAEWCFRRVVESGDDSICLNLGNALADQGRHDEASAMFRRAIDFGDGDAWINLGNSLAAQRLFNEAAVAFEEATSVGDTDAWLNLGQVLEELGDLAGAIRAHQAGSSAGDSNATITWAFMLREQGEPDQAETVAQLAADQGSEYGAAVLACWRYCRTLDPSLESALRAGAEHFASARGDLADLLVSSGRLSEAVTVLQRGMDLGEKESCLQLGNLYRDELHDDAAAERAYRAGIAAGDAHSHHNLASLLEDGEQVDEAINHYRMAAAGGDALAIRALKRLSDSS
jgi:tetratricopeptide (TPR) repeat protein